MCRFLSTIYCADKLWYFKNIGSHGVILNNIPKKHLKKAGDKVYCAELDIKIRGYSLAADGLLPDKFLIFSIDSYAENPEYPYQEWGIPLKEITAAPKKLVGEVLAELLDKNVKTDVEDFLKIKQGFIDIVRKSVIRTKRKSKVLRDIIGSFAGYDKVDGEYIGGKTGIIKSSACEIERSDLMLFSSGKFSVRAIMSNVDAAFDDANGVLNISKSSAYVCFFNPTSIYVDLASSSAGIALPDYNLCITSPPSFSGFLVINKTGNTLSVEIENTKDGSSWFSLFRIGEQTEIINEDGQKNHDGNVCLKKKAVFELEKSGPIRRL